MGKTNVLDSIYYLSFCKSYINSVDSQIIKHGSDVCMLQGKYLNEDETNEEIYAGLKRRQKKQFKRNKKEYERLSDHIGLIPLVMIAPQDVDLIIGGSDVRRRFMDIAISQFDKEYLRCLVRYNKALQQRNVLLKNGYENVDFSLLELWEDQLVSNGMFISNKRSEFIDNLTPIFNYFYCKISKLAEVVSLRYVSQLKEGDYRSLLLENRVKDLALGHTTVGIHRDELEMLLGDYPIKNVGSQGQNKTYFVSLKLAEFNYLKDTGDTMPILLLDDIFDRLDADRVSEIVKLVAGSDFGQIFLSDTNRGSLDKILDNVEDNYKIFSVVEGEVD